MVDVIQVKQFAGGKIDSRNGNFYLKIMFFQIFKISSTKKNRRSL